MFRESREIFSFRTTALLAIATALPGVVAVAVFPRSGARDAFGILFHLTMFFVVSRLPGPAWAKAAGFGWLILDIACGAMMLNGVPHDIAWPVRLGGHLLYGMWIIAVSLLCTDRSVSVLGVIIGLWLSLYTFFGAGHPESLIGPPGVLTLVWIALLAGKYRPEQETASAVTA